MAVSDDLQLLANLCQTGAHRVLDALVSLGPRPTSSPGDLSWDQMSARLQGQMDHLTALVSKLAADAVVVGMAQFQQEALQLGTVTAGANAMIKQIAEVSKLLTTLSRVLDVGLAVLALATAPSPEAAVVLVDKIAALSTELQS